MRNLHEYIVLNGIVSHSVGPGLGLWQYEEFVYDSFFVDGRACTLIVSALPPSREIESRVTWLMDVGVDFDSSLRDKVQIVLNPRALLSEAQKIRTQPDD